MTGNRMSDLNAMLFDQLRRLSDTKMTPEQIESEVTRSTAIVAVAEQISDNVALQLKAAHLVAQHGDRVISYIPAIGRDPATIETAQARDAAKAKPAE